MSAYRLGSTARSCVRVIFTKQLLRNDINNLRNVATENVRRTHGTLKLGLIGAGIGAVVGAAYSVYNDGTKDKTDHMIHEKKMPRVIDKLPDVKIIKRIVNPNDKTDLDLVLFQFQTCPFCCKVRAFLDYQGFSYSVVEVDAVLRQDLKWSEYRKVPMLLAKRKDGKYVQLTDSSTIISLLASLQTDPTQDVGELARFYPSVSFFDDNGSKKTDVMNKYFLMYQDTVPKNTTKEKMQDERKWRSWADDHLVHLISPNVYRTRTEAIETFEWFSEAGEWGVHFPTWERNMMVYVGAGAMWLISKRLKKRHHLSDDVRSHIYDAIDKLTRELKKRNTKYLGGKEPNLADLSAFGILCSMEGCQAFKDCLDNTKMGDWFYGIKEIVNKNKGHVVREPLLIKQMQPNIA